MTEALAGGWDCHVHVFEASAPLRTGHYAPVDRPLTEVETVARQHGVNHLVLVQPSVYGTDNSLLLRALDVEPGRHRGVVVLDGDVSADELSAMHVRGVRGARLNLVSPVGESERANLAQRFANLAPHLSRQGWHMQWYARAEDLATIATCHRPSDVTCVLDHLAGFDVGIGADHSAWHFISELARHGAWLKLSGWYRLNAQSPYTKLVPQIRRLADLFGDRMVWGSDWPHTMFAPDAAPTYGSTWQPVVEALGEREASALRRRAPGIYA